jgi:hypothetical protein
VAKVLSDYGIYIFVSLGKFQKKEEKKLDCLLLDFNRVGCLIFLFTTMCRENG